MAARKQKREKEKKNKYIGGFKRLVLLHLRNSYSWINEGDGWKEFKLKSDSEMVEFIIMKHCHSCCWQWLRWHYGKGWKMQISDKHNFILTEIKYKAFQKYNKSFFILNAKEKYYRNMINSFFSFYISTICFSIVENFISTLSVSDIELSALHMSLHLILTISTWKYVLV